MNGDLKLPRTMVERFRTLSTSTISDALDRLGIEGAVEGLLPTSGASRVSGQAFTLAYLPVGIEGGNVGDYLDDLGEGDLVVIDNRGRTDCTVWGNILTEVAKERGVEGTVIDGVNRDLSESRAIDYPIWSRRGYMRTGKDRVRLAATNVPVCLGHILVTPGDVVCADQDGVLVVPRQRASDVLETALAIDEKEEAILGDVRNGLSLTQARARHNYHSLQTRLDR